MRAFLALLFSLSEFPLIANAAPITFGFTGTVTSIGPAFPQGGGTQVTGTYRFESTSVDTVSSPDFGHYSPATSLSIQMPDSDFEIVWPLPDGYMGSDSYLQLPHYYEMNVVQYRVGWVQFMMFAEDGTFVSDALPLVPPDLASTSAVVFVNFDWGGQFVRSFGARLDSLFIVPAYLAADFNEDGDVDGDDLMVWQAGFGMGGDADRQQGDADGDHDVDGEDFVAWQRQFGNPRTVAATANVPEGATLALLIPGVLAIFFRRLQ
jgi:hypothetical protein